MGRGAYIRDVNWVTYLGEAYIRGWGGELIYREQHITRILWYWNFQNEANVEQIIAIVTTRSVSFLSESNGTSLYTLLNRCSLLTTWSQ